MATGDIFKDLQESTFGIPTIEGKRKPHLPPANCQCQPIRGRAFKNYYTTVLTRCSAVGCIIHSYEPRQAIVPPRHASTIHRRGTQLLRLEATFFQPVRAIFVTPSPPPPPDIPAEPRTSHPLPAAEVGEKKMLGSPLSSHKNPPQKLPPKDLPRPLPRDWCAFAQLSHRRRNRPS